MYFAIGGKNLQLSEIELFLFSDSVDISGNIFFFETNQFHDTQRLAGFTKIGHLCKKSDLDFSDTKIVGTNVRLSKEEKLKFGIKRYKEIDLLKTDFEVKTKGTEIIFFPKNNDFVGIVDFYQNIDLYENIDFEKPVRSMGIGMMPSKLTHLLLNLSVGNKSGKTVYDPFVGLGTTAMIANYFGHNTISSDINITPFKQNRKWFEQTNFYKKDFKCFSFKQDITKNSQNKILNFVTNIVSEGFLGPVVGKYINEKEAINLEKSFQNIYIDGIYNLSKLPNLENIVITFPSYKLSNNSFHIFHDTFYKIKKLGLYLELLGDIYYRKGQKVGRQIVLIKK